MKTSLCIVLPLPPRELSQNISGGQSRDGRRMRAAVKNQYANAAATEARVAWGAGEFPRWPLARVTYTFAFPDRRRRDIVNHMAAMKCAVDAMVEIGLIVDDDWLHLRVAEPKVTLDPECPCATLLFERLMA